MLQNKGKYNSKIAKFMKISELYGKFYSNCYQCGKETELTEEKKRTVAFESEFLVSAFSQMTVEHVICSGCAGGIVFSEKTGPCKHCLEQHFLIV